MKWTTYSHGSVRSIYKDYKSSHSLFDNDLEYWEDFKVRARIGLERSPMNSEFDMGTRVDALVSSAMLSTVWHESNETNHIFINGEVAEFLMSCVREVSKEYLSVGSLRGLTIRDTGTGLFIHFSKKWADIYGINASMAVCVQDWGIWAHIPDDYIVRWSINGRTDAQHDRPIWKAMEVLFGLSLYIDAFPDALREFNAPDYKPWRRSTTLTLRVPKDVQEDIDRSVSPHYRRGHMRVLSNEKYKNKKGQTVFVKGCFVKGRAYEVVG